MKQESRENVTQRFKLNENDDYLVNACLEKGPFILRTWFKHPSIHTYACGEGMNINVKASLT